MKSVMKSQKSGKYYKSYQSFKSSKSRKSMKSLKQPPKWQNSLKLSPNRGKSFKSNKSSKGGMNSNRFKKTPKSKLAAGYPPWRNSPSRNRGKTPKFVKPQLIQKDVTRFYKVPAGPFRVPEDVVKSFGYELKNELDRGAYGIVYVARDLRKSMDVACKVIEVDVSSKDSIDDVKNELLVLERVRHPYVVRLFCHFIVQGTEISRMYLFMELADGGNLFKFLEKQDELPDESLCKLYFAQILSGIMHMHRLSIAHRDIKLQNVLLLTNHQSISGDYVLVVTDFGLSKKIKDTNNPFCVNFVGTPIYMCPEIIQQKPYDPFQADVWALGITLYMMMSLETPFDFNKPDHLVVEAMLARDWSYSCFKSKPSKLYQDLCNKMLEPHQNNRIQMCDVVQHPWVVREYQMANEWARRQVRLQNSGSSTPPPKQQKGY